MPPKPPNEMEVEVAKTEVSSLEVKFEAELKATEKIRKRIFEGECEL